jgi:hypothetical protein
VKVPGSAEGLLRAILVQEASSRLSSRRVDPT